MHLRILSCYTGQKYTPVQERFGEICRIVVLVSPQELSVLPCNFQLMVFLPVLGFAEIAPLGIDFVNSRNVSLGSWSCLCSEHGPVY